MKKKSDNKKKQEIDRYEPHNIRNKYPNSYSQRYEMKKNNNKNFQNESRYEAIHNNEVKNTSEIYKSDIAVDVNKDQVINYERINPLVKRQAKSMTTPTIDYKLQIKLEKINKLIEDRKKQKTHLNVNENIRQYNIPYKEFETNPRTERIREYSEYIKPLKEDIKKEYTWKDTDTNLIPNSYIEDRKNNEYKKHLADLNDSTEEQKYNETNNDEEIDSKVSNDANIQAKNSDEAKANLKSENNVYDEYVKELKVAKKIVLANNLDGKHEVYQIKTMQEQEKEDRVRIEDLKKQYRSNNPKSKSKPRNDPKISNRVVTEFKKPSQKKTPNLNNMYYEKYVMRNHFGSLFEAKNNVKTPQKSNSKMKICLAGHTQNEKSSKKPKSRTKLPPEDQIFRSNSPIIASHPKTMINKKHIKKDEVFQICMSNSKENTESKRNVIERSELWVKNRNKKSKEGMIAKQDKELIGCTFHPSIVSNNDKYFFRCEGYQSNNLVQNEDNYEEIFDPKEIEESNQESQ